MIAHRLPRWLGTVVVVALLALGILASACAGIASPRGWASPVLSDDFVVVAHRDKLFALDPATLDPQDARWVFPADEADDDIDAVALYGTPAVTKNAVLVPAYDGTLYALDRETGAVLWSYETDGPLVGGVVVSAETAYFGSSDGKVYAVEVGSGRLAWNRPFETDNEVWSSPAVAGDTVYVTSLDHHLYALDAEAGTERWSFATAAGIASPPVVDEESGLVYVGGFDSRLRAVNAETGEERWSVKADNWFWTEPLVAGGVVYAGSLDGRVYAVKAGSGEDAWPSGFSAKGPIRAAPVIANGALVVVDREGDVYAIDVATGDSAVSDSPLELDSDVLADPVVLVGGIGEGDEAKAEVVVVTTGGDLVRIDAGTLKEVGGRIALAE